MVVEKILLKMCSNEFFLKHALVRRRPPEPDPLRVDVINGWPLTVMII